MVEMKTFAWAEIVFGIADLGLGTILYLSQTYFKRETTILLAIGGLGIFGGLCLFCLGGKPSYGCVKANTLVHFGIFLGCFAGLAVLSRHVPYEHGRYCDSSSYSSSCTELYPDAEVLVNRILAFTIAILVLQALMNVVVMVMGMCSMFDSLPEPGDPECIGSTTTTEKLCPPPQQQQQQQHQQQQVMAAGEDMKWADADST